MQNMWNFGYSLDAKLQAKNGNEWYIIDVAPAGPTSEEDRAFGMDLFKGFRTSNLIYDMDESSTTTADTVDTTKVLDADNVEF